MRIHTSIPMRSQSTCNFPGGVWKYNPFSGSAYGRTDKIYDNFFILQLSGYFTEGVQLFPEKGAVKCVETLQGFSLIDSSL